MSRTVVFTTLIVVTLIAGVPQLGDRGFWPPDEARYGEVSRELFSGDNPWVIPHLNGEVYPDKPPGYFLAIAAVGQLRGQVDEAAARWPSVIAGLVTALVVAAWLLKITTPLASLIGGLCVLGSGLFAYQLRYAQMDMLVTALTGLMMFSFWRAVSDRSGRWAFLAWVWLGLGMFVKGPVALLPLPFFLVWSIRSRKWRVLVERPSVYGFLLLIGGMLSWLSYAYIVREAAGPGEGEKYLRALIGDQTVGRTYRARAHEKPWWYYGKCLPLILLPFGFLLLAFFKTKVRSHLKGEMVKVSAFALGWGLSVVVLASVLPGKRSIYLLPLMVPAGLGFGCVFTALSATAPQWLTRMSGVVGASTFLLGCLALGLGWFDGSLQWARAAIGERGAEKLDLHGIRELSSECRRSLMLFGAVTCSLGGTALVLALARRQGGAMVGACLASLAVVSGSMALLAPHANPYISREPFAQQVVRLRLDEHRSESPIAMFFHLDEALPFYMKATLPEVPAAAHGERVYPTTQQDRMAAFDALYQHLSFPGALCIANEKHLKRFGLMDHPALRVRLNRQIGGKRFMLLEARR